MTLLPVIERELRAESRSAFTYWLRFSGAGAMVLGCIVWFLDKDNDTAQGTELYRMLHIVMFTSMWLVSMLLTVDAISRERREGTLGLLFLTPLRPIAVVLAKGLAHGLRAAGVGMAAVPVLAIPFLMGGVGWRVAVASVLVNFTALCWALAIGLLASSFCKSMMRALVVAVILEMGTLLMLLVVSGTTLMSITASASAGNARRFLESGFEDVLQHGFYVLFVPDAVFSWARRGGISAAGASDSLWSLATIAAASLIACLLLVVLAAQNVRRAARDRERSAVMQKVEREFCTPTFALGFYRGWMRRVLERNPIGWLERRTWQARLVTWSWLAVMVAVLSWYLGLDSLHSSNFSEPLVLLGWALASNVMLTSAGSLRRERESGVIELLLVTPLSERQIIRGRLRGIAGQFLPAAGMLLATWLWLMYAFSSVFNYRERRMDQWGMMGFLVCTLATAPVIGLYFSLRCRVFLVAVFWTVAVCVILPYAAGEAIWWALHTERLVTLPHSWRVESGGVLVIGAALAAVMRGRRLALVLGGAAAVAFATYVCEGDSTRDLQVFPIVAITMPIQAGAALLLAGLLKQRLERRDFVLPQ